MERGREKEYDFFYDLCDITLVGGVVPPSGNGLSLQTIVSHMSIPRTLLLLHNKKMRETGGKMKTMMH
jgi:hypothetical protein